MDKQARYLLLEGNNFEVGRVLGKIYGKIPGFSDAVRSKETFLTQQAETQMYRLFDEFCPGINEEIAGFADELKLPAGQILYYAMTYLRPGCSQMAVLPSKTQNGHTLLARNYDFNDKVEEMALSVTRIHSRFAHIGSSIMQFGRADGMNEHGLAASQTSAGLPVGNFEFAAKPAIVGLQFWAVIRSVLENCKNVDEAMQWTKQMPIAYNINLLLADRDGNSALIETFNGKKAFKKIGPLTGEQFICSTNHVHLPELKVYAPLSMRNSLWRYKLISETLDINEHVSIEDLKELLSTQYPEGLCCHFYDEFFGTLRSMVFDLDAGLVEVCFGSPALNKWYSFKISQEVKQGVFPVKFEREKAPADFYEMIGDC